MKVRCKFTCVKIIQTPCGYEAEFAPVHSGSKENDKFFKYTPGGSLMLCTLKKQHFKPGKDYYLDISTIGKSDMEAAE